MCVEWFQQCNPVTSRKGVVQYLLQFLLGNLSFQEVMSSKMPKTDSKDVLRLLPSMLMISVLGGVYCGCVCVGCARFQWLHHCCLRWIS